MSEREKAVSDLLRVASQGKGETRVCARCSEETPRWRVDPLQPRLVCPDCYDEQDRVAERQRWDLVNETKRIVTEAKSKGRLPEADAAWLKRNNLGDTVAALEKRFQGEGEGRGRRRGGERDL